MSGTPPNFLVEAGAAGNYPANRFNQRERKLLESVRNYINSQLPLTGITNSQLAGTAGTASPGASGLSQVATAVYDFSVNGGAISTIPLGVLLPKSAVVWGVTTEIVTAPTSAGSTGHIKLNLPVDGDLTANILADGAAANLNTFATSVPKDTTDIRQLSVVITTTALTAGKIRFFVHYVQSALAPIVQNLIHSLMGASSNFEILGNSTVTNTGSSAVTGDVGVSPGTSITGFPPGVISGGSQHSNDAAAIAAQSALGAAITSLAALSFTSDLTGQDLGSRTLTAGVYKFTSSAPLTGTLTLDAGGNPGAQFVFQIGTTLIAASNAQVVLINGASSDNVCWNVGSSATIGTSAQMQGNILAQVSITMNTSASNRGRLLASTGAVTLDTNAASNP